MSNRRFQIGLQEGSLGKASTDLSGNLMTQTQQRRSWGGQDGSVLLTRAVGKPAYEEGL